MHIAFVLPIGEYYSTEWSGAIATITRHLARRLRESGHRVTVLTPDDGGTTHGEGAVVRLRHGSAHPPPVLLRKANTAVARARGWTWPDYGPYIRAVGAALRGLDEPVDAVVVANDPMTADRLARGGRAGRVVLWLHNRLDGPEARPLRTLSSAVEVVAVSASVAEWTVEQHLPGRSVHVIHSGVDHDAFHPREGWLDARDPVRVVCHGRIDPNKGQVDAAAAVAMLRAKGLPVELTVIGQVRTFGFSKEEEEAYARRLDDAISAAGGRLVGWMPQEQLAVELRGYDVACVLSRVHEPFALSTLEALAAGCAVIGTRMGGTPEAVGTAGALVAPDAPDEVAAVLEGWVRDRDALAAMKRAAVERAGAFTWAATADALVALLRD